jgi:dihydrofolate reductase
MHTSIIVAVAQNGAIGYRGQVPWRLRTDLRLFRQTTMGHHLIVGRRTWESIGRPLAGREMVVVTRDEGYAVPQGVTVVHSVENALGLARENGESEAFIAGGAQLYAITLKHANRIYYTEVHTAPDADTWFPEWDRAEWVERECRDYPAGEGDQFSFRWCELDRVS